MTTKTPKTLRLDWRAVLAGWLASGYVREGVLGMSVIGQTSIKLLSIAQGCEMEIKGIRMWRGKTAYALAKQEFGLRGSREAVAAAVRNAYAALQLDLQTMGAVLDLTGVEPIPAAWSGRGRIATLDGGAA